MTGDAGFAAVYRQSEKLSRLREIELERPTLAFPDDNQQGLAGPVAFTWKDAAATEKRAAKYRHCIWPEEAEFGFQFCGKEVLQNNTLEVSTLQPGKTHFWKVIVEGENGIIKESETRRFTTK